MDRESLITTLGLLSQGRAQLVSKFTHQDKAIFGDMFRFERSPALMALAVDRFNVSWITHHYELFEKLDESASPEAAAAFKTCVLGLIQRLDQSREGDLSAEWAFVKSMIAEKKMILEAQFDFSNKDDVNYRKLVFAQDRERALFERAFEKAKEKLS